MAGAPGFEPGIAGPKPAALPLGYAPLRPEYKCGPRPGSAAIREQDEERDHREQRDDRDRHGLDEAERERHAEDDQLGGGQDPADLADDVRPARASREPPEPACDEREQDCLPPAEDANQVQDPLDGREAQCDAEATQPEPAARPRGPVLDRVRHLDPSYQAGPATHVRPSRLSAEQASSAAALSSNSPYTTGPAPLTSARNAPSARSAAACAERARSFGGSPARSRGTRMCASARRKASTRAAYPSAPPRASNAS